MAGFKGRGAVGNPVPRYLRTGIESVDDGWYREETPDSIATEVRPEPARTIITRNDSPDIGFEQSINPYRGCEHGCIYCLSGDTPILMVDGGAKPLETLRAGDWIMGTRRHGWHRRYVGTQVLAHWSVIKPAYRITLADGTGLQAGGDHRFLTTRGWKFVSAGEREAARRPHLTARDRLTGVGAFAAAPTIDDEYRVGYLTGLIRGDGLSGEHADTRPACERESRHHFRLALRDEPVLDRAAEFLQQFDVDTSRYNLCVASGGRRAIQAIRAHARLSVQRVHDLIEWPAWTSPSWCKGFVAGTFDAGGSYSDGVLRISMADGDIIAQISAALRLLGFENIVEHRASVERRPIDVVRLAGGLREHLRFFHAVAPAITRKVDIAGQAVESAAKLNVVAVEPLGAAMRLFDITTGTEDFIANGVVSHNCYARPSHAYMDLSPGVDFETKLFYKADAQKLLTEELAKPGYVPKPINLGANTDPYQPLENRLKVTRSVVEVLERTRHPVSFVTKGSLILRDLDLLQSLAADNLVQVFVSVTTLDTDLKRVMEPRTASPLARLRVIRELRAAGIPTGVMVAPMIPMINDSEMESILEAIREAGATQAHYVLLRLPHELKELFREWLDTHFPDRAEHVMSLIRGARGGRENDPRFGTRMVGSGAWAQLLRDRFQLACRRLHLNEGNTRSLSTGHFRPPSPGGQMSLL